MSDGTFYHDGNRALQAEFDSGRIASRLESFVRTEFSEPDREFIESSIFFFLATADAEGRPDCSYRGGPAGFVRVTGPSELAFPDYDGNGMFRSLGNLTVNPHLGMLFIAMNGRPHRLRVNGRARVYRDDPLLAEMVGAQLIVRVRARAIFPNCPRYIPHLQVLADSPYVPRPGCAPVEPEWKSYDEFKDAVPERRPTWNGTAPGHGAG